MDEKDAVDFDGSFFLIVTEVTDFGQGFDADVKRDLRGGDPHCHSISVLEVLDHFRQFLHLHSL